MTHDHPAAFALFAVWRDNFPDWLRSSGVAGIAFADWIGLAAFAAGAVVVGAVGQWVVLRGAGVVARRTGNGWDDRLIELLPGPLSALIGLFAFALAVPYLGLAPAADGVLDVVIPILLIAASTVLAARFIRLAGEGLEAYLARGVEDDNRRRSIHTQVSVPQGILRAVVYVVGVALALIQFEAVRGIGVSLLASAGLAGIVLGFAAQKTVGNLLAGIQLAIFQPIRIGDAVVVEGEWGWVEEIGLTHVVVKVWDLRRLVLPVTQFLEKPFQNWTRGAHELLGTVLLYADYTVPIDPVRDALKDILRGTDLWDGRAQGVQVTNLTERAVELRVLMSARDGGQLWDLRCLVREKLLGWLQAAGHSHLPLQRVELTPAPEAPPPEAGS
jgi:small-conductance mechanosensitive channel